MRFTLVFVVVLVLAGCTVAPSPAPTPTPTPTPAAPSAFSFGAPAELETDPRGRITITLSRAMDPDSVQEHFVSSAQVVDVQSEAIHLLLHEDQGDAVLRAGAQAQDGSRLEQDWVIRLRRASPPPIARTERPWGFEFGPFDSLNALAWDGPDRLTFSFWRWEKAGTATVDLKSGELRTGETRPLPLALKGTNQNVSPDGSLSAGYFKVGPGIWADLRSGESHKLEGPGYYGSLVFDAWAPDSSRYLVQAMRNDPVPGFYLFGRDGKLGSTWHEPGYFSDWASWAPDSRRIAFLSTPLDLKYPSPPEAWDELLMAPRVGVLDLATGKAKYYAVDGLVAYGRPVWSPDGNKIAITFGPLQDRGGFPDVLRGRIYVIDLTHDTLRPITAPVTADTSLYADSWSPDSSALLILSLGLNLNKDGSATQRYDRTELISLSGGEPVILPRRSFWIDSDRLLAHGTLVDRQGNELAVLTSGDPYRVAVSPDRTHVALAVGTQLTIARIR